MMSTHLDILDLDGLVSVQFCHALHLSEHDQLPILQETNGEPRHRPTSMHFQSTCFALLPWDRPDALLGGPCLHLSEALGFH